MATIDDLTPILAAQVSGTDLMYVGVPTDPDPDRNATINQMRDVFLADDSVTNAKLRDSVGLSVIGRAGSTTGNPADIVAATDGHALRRSGTSVGFGQIGTNGIADDAIVNAKVLNVDASKVTTGTLDAARIPVIDSSKLSPVPQPMHRIFVGRVGTSTYGLPEVLPAGWTATWNNASKYWVIGHTMGTSDYVCVATLVRAANVLTLGAVTFLIAEGAGGVASTTQFLLYPRRIEQASGIEGERTYMTSHPETEVSFIVWQRTT